MKGVLTVPPLQGFMRFKCVNTVLFRLRVIKSIWRATTAIEKTGTKRPECFLMIRRLWWVPIPGERALWVVL